MTMIDDVLSAGLVALMVPGFQHTLAAILADKRTPERTRTICAGLLAVGAKAGTWKIPPHNNHGEKA